MRFQSTLQLPPEKILTAISMKLRKKPAPRRRQRGLKARVEKPWLDAVLAAGKGWQTCLAGPKAVRRKSGKQPGNTLRGAAAGVIRKKDKDKKEDPLSQAKNQ